MEWNKHPELRGKHTFLSPSKYSSASKSDEELIATYYSSFASMIGTAIHEFAAECIRQRHELWEDDWRHLAFELTRQKIPAEAYDIGFIFPTVLCYVNDCIGYNMDPEVGLSYHPDLYAGTADAIAFRRKRLRISDLKTGVTPAKIDQLIEYAALFFMEYGHKPESTHTELRIYQAGEIVFYEPKPDEIREVMETRVHQVSVLQHLKEE